MSSIPRLFVAQDLVEGAAFPLDDAQANYLLRVLRLVADAPVRVFNGRDGEWEARIVDVHGKRASLTPERLVRPQPETPASAPVLLFAPVKKAETDFIVEKATELGAARISPVLTDRTQTRSPLRPVRAPHRLRIPREGSAGVALRGRISPAVLLSPSQFEGDGADANGTSRCSRS